MQVSKECPSSSQWGEKTTFDLRMKNRMIEIFRLSQIKDEIYHRWALDPWVLLPLQPEFQIW